MVAGEWVSPELFDFIISSNKKQYFDYPSSLRKFDDSLSFLLHVFLCKILLKRSESSQFEQFHSFFVLNHGWCATDCICDNRR